MLFDKIVAFLKNYIYEPEDNEFPESEFENEDAFIEIEPKESETEAIEEDNSFL